ncbi:MAG TPA: tetratricopeptide repeat protein [Elusimicrobiales bacterium]|nr:tetratricopeptide repeat protein [Elusimicrobiales bacterium]
MKAKTLSVILAAAALPAVFCAPLRAQENETPNGRLGAGTRPESGALPEKRVSSIRMKNVTLEKFLSVVSRQTGVSFTIDRDLADTHVTVFLRASSLREVMELLWKTKDVDFIASGPGNNYRVARSTTVFKAFPPLIRKDIEDPLFQRVVKGIRVKEAPLATFLDIVSAKSKVNFVLTEGVQNIRITNFIRSTTLADVLLFLRGEGVSYSRVGNTNTFVLRRIEKPENDDFVRAEKAFRDARYDEAAALYKEIAGQYPDSELADYALLKAAVNYDWIAARDNSPAALKEEEALLRRLIRDYPKSQRLGDAYLYLGQIYSGYGGVKTGVDCEKAVKFYESAIQSTYRDWVKAQAIGRMAQCYELAGKKEKAADLYAEIQEKYPGTETAKELRGRAGEKDPILETGAILEEKGLYELAIGIYSSRWEGSTEASVRTAELRIGICQAAMKRTDEAIKTLDAYLAKYRPAPGDEVYSQIAEALEKAGRPGEARKYREIAEP